MSHAQALSKAAEQLRAVMHVNAALPGDAEAAALALKPISVALGVYAAVDAALAPQLQVPAHPHDRWDDATTGMLI